MAKEIEIIKKGYSKDRFNLNQIEELKRCMTDPIYFCKNYVKIQHPTQGRVPFSLWPYQEDMIDSFHKNRFSIALTARQMGKCLGINTLVKLRSPLGEEIELEIGEFYEWQSFRKWCKTLPELRSDVSRQDQGENG